MSINLLDYFLFTQLGAFFLIFCRIGSAFMVLPGFGEVYVSPRIRLLLALSVSLLVTPLLQPNIPQLPGSGFALAVMIMGEVLVGAFFGLIARAILMSLHVAGNIIAAQSSLAVASMFDPSSGSQSAVISNLLTLAAVVLFFALNLHHLVIATVVQSYTMFEAGKIPSTMDMNVLHLRLVSDAFALGVALAAPHIVVSLLFYLGGGLMSRLMPNFQVFFVMMSPQILIAFFLLLAVVPVILGIFANNMESQYTDFVGSE